MSPVLDTVNHAAMTDVLHLNFHVCGDGLASGFLW
jgi:hypothetical protein